MGEDKILIRGLTFGGVDYGDVVSYREYKTLQESNKVLVEAICIYAREELGHVDFNGDKGAVNFFIKAYSEESIANEQEIKDERLD